MNTKDFKMRLEAQKARFQPNIFLLLLFIVIMFFVAYILPQFILGTIFEGDSVSGVVQDVSYLFVTVITTITGIIYCTKVEKRSLLSMGFSKSHFLRKYFFGYLYGILILVGIVGICAMFGAVEIAKSKLTPMVILFFVGYIIQGMSEEVALRGCLMMSASNKVPIWTAIIISSLFFTIPHVFFSGFQILYSINIFLMGIFLACYIIRTDNIWGACGLHAGFNFFLRCFFNPSQSSSCNLYVVSSDIPEKILMGGNSYGYTSGLVMTGVIIIAILLTVFIPKKSLTPKIKHTHLNI